MSISSPGLLKPSVLYEPDHISTILVLSHTSDFNGGAEKSMVDFFDKYTTLNKQVIPHFIVPQRKGVLINELKARNWDYTVIDFSVWLWPKLVREPESIYREHRKNMRAVASITELIIKLSPKAVITNTIVAPWAALAAAQTHTKHIWFVREYGDLDHGLYFEIGKQKTIEDIYNLSDQVITISKALYNNFASHLKQTDKLSLIYNSIPKDRILEMASLMEDVQYYRYQDSLKLVIVGRVSESKGQFQLIKAISRIPKNKIIELNVVGCVDKAYKQKIMEFVTNRGLTDRIHFVDHVDNPYTYIKHADIAVMASKKEAFGRVTAEYMVLGKPIIAAATGGTTELIEDHVNGMLYEPDSNSELLSAIQFYLNSPELVVSHGSASTRKLNEIMTGSNSFKEKISVLDNMIHSSAYTEKTFPNYFTQLVDSVKHIQKYLNKIEAQHRTLLKAYAETMDNSQEGNDNKDTSKSTKSKGNNDNFLKKIVRRG